MILLFYFLTSLLPLMQLFPHGTILGCILMLLYLSGFHMYFCSISQLFANDCVFNMKFHFYQMYEYSSRIHNNNKGKMFRKCN